MRLFRPKPTFTRQQISRSLPLRNAHVQFERHCDGSILIRVPISKKGLLGFTLGRLAPSHREIELEPIGAFVWEMCDGKNTCHRIAEALAKRYRITKAESEAALLAFLDMLAKRRLIHLKVPSK